jgi:hypothetical protein
VVVSAVFRCIEIVFCLEYKDFLPFFTSSSSEFVQCLGWELLSVR